MIFLSYVNGSKGYRFYDYLTGRVRATRDVIFNEDNQWDWEILTNHEDRAD